MPENDCGICNKLINCAGTLITRVEFQTLVGKLLCEGVDSLNTLSLPFQFDTWKAFDNKDVPQANTVLLAAPGAGLRFYITDIVLSNGATEGNIRLVEDTGGAADDLMPPFYFGENGGTSLELTTPIEVSENVDIGYTSVGVTTHSVMIIGYTAPS